MKNIVSITISLFLSSYLFAQSKYSLGLTTGYTYAKSHFIQIGAIYGTDYGNVHTPSKGFGIGADISKINNKYAVGTKIFYEHNFFILTAFRLNAVNYFSEQQNLDFRLMPQFGLSLFGYLNLLYGYSIPTLGNEYANIGRHSISLTLNLLKGAQ